MKLGLQTIPWGPRVRDVTALARGAHAIGYRGLEFAQRVDTLGSADNLCTILSVEDMQCIGLAGGALEDCIEYAIAVKAYYVLTMEWDEGAVRRALDQGIRVALHPHWRKGIESLAMAEHYLKLYPSLGLIVDTAHLFLAGDDVIGALQRHFPRVWAVHFKDWSSRWGTSPLRFAKGFTALGDGLLGDLLETTLCYLQRRKFKGWCIVEQDFANGDPFDSAKRSYDWLQARVMS